MSSATSRNAHLNSADTACARIGVAIESEYWRWCGGRSGHISDTGVAMLAETTGITVSAHDLRRTYASIAESADISHVALKLLLNHVVGADVTSGYVVMTTERPREAAQRVADKIKGLCGTAGATAANVARL